MKSYKTERAKEIAKELNKGKWDIDLCAELCILADMEKEYDEADDNTFKSVICAAAEKLCVSLA